MQNYKSKFKSNTQENNLLFNEKAYKKIVNFNKKYYLYVLLCCILVSGCTDKMRQNGSMDKPDQVIEGFEVNHTIGGILSWNLSAEHANIYEQKKVARAEKPKIMFYEDEQLSSTLTSRHALLHTETSDIEAWEDVVIVSAVEKSRLETTRAYYKSGTNKIYSDEPVRFIQKESVTTGTGMESTIDLSSIIIKNQKVVIVQRKGGHQDTKSPGHQ